MTDSGSREIIVTETKHDLEALRDKVLCCGHTITGPDGIDRINVIWKQAQIAPITSFEWQTKYALNFKFIEPAPGVVTSVSGMWQPCRLGESYRIDSEGFWEKGPEGSGKANRLNIAGNDFERVWPVVGIWTESERSYKPAYVDRTPLDQGASVDYQPGPYSRVWYACKDTTVTSEIIQDDGGQRHAATIETRVPNPKTHKFVWVLTFDSNTKKWINSPEN